MFVTAIDIVWDSGLSRSHTHRCILVSFRDLRHILRDSCEHVTWTTGVPLSGCVVRAVSDVSRYVARPVAPKEQGPRHLRPTLIHTWPRAARRVRNGDRMSQYQSPAIIFCILLASDGIGHQLPNSVTVSRHGTYCGD